MCEKCEKQCYQIAFFNEVHDEKERGLCYKIEHNCGKIIKINDKLFCCCSNNPEKFDYNISREDAEKSIREEKTKKSL